jgi:PAS domain S-box-containing protein
MSQLFYTLPLFVTAAVSVVIAGYSWRRRELPTARLMALLGVTIAWWALFYALELASDTGSLKVLWAQLQYIAIAVIPVAWLLFALRHTNLDRLLIPRLAGLLALIPIVTVALVWTNDSHGLIWKEVMLEPSGAITAFVPKYGGWFYVNLGYAYILVLAGSGILLADARRSFRTFRLQAVIMVAAALFPLVGNALLITGLTLPGNLDLTPFGFAVSVIVATWGFARLRLLDLVPVARAAVMDRLPDGLLVVDHLGRIVDINPRAAEILEATAEDLVGQPLPGELAGDLAARIGAQGEVPEEVAKEEAEPESHQAISLGPQQNRRIYDVGVSPIGDGHGRVSGTVLLLRDITLRQATEKALVNTNRGLELEIERRRVVERALIRSEQIRRLQTAEEAKESERKRLSEELHDETLVQLSSVVAELGLVSRMLSTGADGAEESLVELRERVKTTEQGLRRIVLGIYPAVLTNLGLVPALRAHLGELSRRTGEGTPGVKIDMKASGFGEARLPEDIEVAVYRVVQQSVANSLAHARPSMVHIELNRDASQLQLSVADDGIGFDVDQPEGGPEAGHFGLVNLRDRVADAGGNLTVRSADGLGTAVEATIPTSVHGDDTTAGDDQVSFSVEVSSPHPDAEQDSAV